MSGCSDSLPCARCGNEMDRYVDWKPFEYMDGQCAHCGFYFTTIYGIMNKTDLKTCRDEVKEMMDGKWEIGKIPTKKVLAEFDKNYSIKTDKEV